MREKSGERTLLASVLLSAPGPIFVGIGFFLGRSTTQLADFIRRSAELIAIVVSWAVFRYLNKAGDIGTKRIEKLERTANLSVGVAMTLSGIAMIFIAYFAQGAEKGNVVPGLIIAVLGVVVNTWFWLRYRKLDRIKPDSILAVQSRLYLAKSIVDACVGIALGVMAAAPGTPVAMYVDIGGSIIVAVYLIVNGINTIRGCNIELKGKIRSAVKA